jgi:transposase
MTQRDRDRLVVLKKAQKKLIKQSQAAKELDITPRQIRRLLRRLREQGDAAVVHALRGRQSNRRVSEETRQKIVQVLSQQQYRDFGPTLAAEYLHKKYKVKIGREALRQIMIAAGLWRARRQKVEEVHEWRARRSCRGELVQWDTSNHDWLEGRGPRLYLIHMIDDATSELTARFVTSDSTAENMRLLWFYVEKHGRPLSFYTDKASLFQTTPKTSQHLSRVERDPKELPPTQIGRGLRELGIGWIAAHSPQAKGRVERSFQTAQDRLVKGLRIACARTLEDANRYLAEEFVPWWNQHLTVTPANPTEAHRPLRVEHDLVSALSHVETRQVASDYTLRYDGKIYQIARRSIVAGLRGSNVRVEYRLDGTIAVRFRDRNLEVSECIVQPKAKVKAPASPRAPKAPKVSAVERLGNIDLRKGLPVWIAGQIG